MVRVGVGVGAPQRPTIVVDPLTVLLPLLGNHMYGDPTIGDSNPTITLHPSV